MEISLFRESWRLFRAGIVALARGITGREASEFVWSTNRYTPAERKAIEDVLRRQYAEREARKVSGA